MQVARFGDRLSMLVWRLQQRLDWVDLMVALDEVGFPYGEEPDDGETWEDLWRCLAGLVDAGYAKAPW